MMNDPAASAKVYPVIARFRDSDQKIIVTYHTVYSLRSAGIRPCNAPRSIYLYGRSFRNDDSNFDRSKILLIQGTMTILHIDGQSQADYVCTDLYVSKQTALYQTFTQRIITVTALNNIVQTVQYRPQNTIISHRPRTFI